MINIIGFLRNPPPWLDWMFVTLIGVSSIGLGVTVYGLVLWVYGFPEKALAVELFASSVLGAALRILMLWVVKENKRRSGSG